MMKKRKLSAILASALLLTSLFTGCTTNGTSSKVDSGSSSGTQATSSTKLTKVTFRLNWKATGLHAPYYYALEKGYYKDVGLDVTIGEGTGSGTTAKLVGSGTDMLGLVDSASVASAVQQGIPIHIVCPIYAVNGFGIVALEGSGITKPKDLEGKKVGLTTGDGPNMLFGGIVKAQNIDKSKINLISMDGNSKVSSLVNKKVDAVLAGADNEAIQAENMGAKVKVLRYSDFGVPTIGLSVIAGNDSIKNNPDIIKKFNSATLKAWDDARKNPDAAVDVIVKHIPTLDKRIARAGLDVAISSLFTSTSKTLGDVSDTEWATSMQLLKDYMGVSSSLKATDIYTNECLPDNRPAK